MKKIVFLFAIVAVAQALPQLGDIFVFPPYERQFQSVVKPKLRIVGGQDAAPHAYPYQVGIYVDTADEQTFCGGSLISHNFVLTAAHCVDKALRAELIFGAHNITTVEDTQVRVTATSFVIHKGWDRSLLANDIALIKLPAPVKESKEIRIIDIATGTYQFDGDLATATGWGLTGKGDDTVHPILKYVASPILTNDECSKVNNAYNKIVKPSILCLSGKGNVGTCQGDSGGPLTVNGVQVGLVSFGYKDCTIGMPSVFTRLTEYTDWIAEYSDVTD